MGVQQRVHRRVEFDFPKDFPGRLALFKEASGLSWKALARLLGVRPYRLWQWRGAGRGPQPRPSLPASDHRREHGTAGTGF